MGIAQNVQVREIDVVRAKGKSDSMTIVEVLDACSPDDRDRKLATLAQFQHGRTLYKQGDFTSAHAMFAACLSANPDDGAARVLAERCMEFAQQPPADWNGVATLMSK